MLTNLGKEGEMMKHLKLVILVISVFCFMSGGMVFSQYLGSQSGSRMSCQDRFDALDANHDGKLTLEEFMATAHHRRNPEERFKALDVNNHGYLTKEEFCSGRGGHGTGGGM
jgi:heme A synthase